MDLRRAAIGAVAVAVLAASLTAGAAAQAAAPRTDPLADASAALRAEVALLVQLGALRAPVPPELIEVRDRQAAAVQRLDRSGQLAGLDEVDAAGAAAMREALAQGIPLAPASRRVLARLGPLDVQAVRAGRVISLDPDLYVRTVTQLPGRVAGPSVAGPSVAGPSVAGPSVAGTSPAAGSRAADPAAATSTVATSAEAGQDASTQPQAPRTTAFVALLLAATAAGAIVAGLLGWVAARARRRRTGGGVATALGRQTPGSGTTVRDTIAPDADAAAAFDRLLDAGRRMTRALDAVQTARIAVTEAISMTTAARGAFVRVSDRGLAVLDDPDGVLQPRQLDAGLLRRVADTGQAAVQVCRDEPALTGLPCSVLAVPVAGSGRVVGVLLLVRPDTAPFSAADERAVSRLAPMAGSALLAAEQHDGVSELTRVDALTGLPNRRRLDADLAALAVRTPETAPQAGALVMIDVDHFKVYNDRNGHAAGDLALRAVAEALRAAVRDVDTPYRYGGEEFSLMLREVDVAGAAEIAERVRAQVEACEVAGATTQPAGRLTVSIGLAMLTDGDPADVLRRADQALYEAKQGGRNRVVVSPQR